VAQVQLNLRLVDAFTDLLEYLRRVGGLEGGVLHVDLLQDQLRAGRLAVDVGVGHVDSLGKCGLKCGLKAP